MIIDDDDDDDDDDKIDDADDVTGKTARVRERVLSQQDVGD